MAEKALNTVFNEIIDFLLLLYFTSLHSNSNYC